MNHNQSKKSKQVKKSPKTNNQMVLWNPKNVAKLQNRKQNIPKNVLRNFDMQPQSRSKKSATGASYNDGFDVSSKPERRLVRVEEFDELITTVIGQTGFTILTFACNPGQATVFPRLSKFAQLYERYRWKKLEFYFQHDVSQFNAQGAAGLVILSGLYDAASSTPTSKAQVEVTEPHVICMPNQNSLLKFNTGRLHPQGLPLFVRPSGLPGGADIKTYDAANMFLTVQGMAGSGEVGELHVRGQVEFIGDILDASLQEAPQNNQVSFFYSEGLNLTQNVVTILPLGTALSNGLSCVNTAGSIVPPAGNYLVDAMASTFVTTGDGTGALFTVNKNGVPVGMGAGSIITNTPGPLITLNNSVFVSCNGTDALTLAITGYFTVDTGVCSADGQVRITAI